MTRLWAAAEAEGLGWGGGLAVTKATGILGKRITAGRQDLKALQENPPTDAPHKQRVRREGAGRKRLEDRNPELVVALTELIDPVTRGDPESALRWTTKSTRKLAKELATGGHSVSASKVCQLLHAMGYSLQGTRKTTEGAQHPDRDAQFKYIARRAKEFHRDGQPVISVDTKKKELIGDFANKGSEWQVKGDPVPVRVHDFIDRELGKAVPYGVYDLWRNEGWVNVGINHDTAEFAVESIRRWWDRMGKQAYPEASELMITADAGGSNGARVRLWKTELQKLANDTGLKILVCHYPPGTSKWNKIEHRMFCHITQNWRGRPLESVETVVNLIGATTTEAGLTIRADVDENEYAKGVKVSDEELAAVELQPGRARPGWNYRISTSYSQ